MPEIERSLTGIVTGTEQIELDPAGGCPGRGLGFAVECQTGLFDTIDKVAIFSKLSPCFAESTSAWLDANVNET